MTNFHIRLFLIEKNFISTCAILYLISPYNVHTPQLGPAFWGDNMRAEGSSLLGIRKNSLLELERLKTEKKK